MGSVNVGEVGGVGGTASWLERRGGWGVFCWEGTRKKQVWR